MNCLAAAGDCALSAATACEQLQAVLMAGSKGSADGGHVPANPRRCGVGGIRGAAAGAGPRWRYRVDGMPSLGCG